LHPRLRFSAGDFVYFLARSESLPRLGALFDPHSTPDRLDEHRYFGDFLLRGDVRLEELAEVYDLPVEAGEGPQTLAQHFARVYHDRVVVGDRVRLGAAELVVRETEDGLVVRVGLRLPMLPHS
jgi:cell volume regulation protein A